MQLADPALRFPLRGSSGVEAGALEHIWEVSLPAVADSVCGGQEYLEGCRARTARAHVQQGAVAALWYTA